MSSRHRIGLIGLGFGGRVHLPAYQDLPNVDVVAVADAGSGAAREIADRYGIAYACSDWRSVVALVDVDLISVATPPEHHVEIVAAALNNGKHVLCEKPLGRSLKESDALSRMAEESGCVHAVGYQYRMEPRIAMMRDLISSGEIGKVLRIDVTWLTSGRSDPSRPWSWQHDRKAGGGVLNAFGSQAIDYIEFISMTKIRSVIARSGILVPNRKDRSGKNHKVTAEDEVDLLFELSSGAKASLRISNCYPAGSEHQIEVYGEGGYLISSHEPPFRADNVRLLMHRANGEFRMIPITAASVKIDLDPLAVSFQRLANRFLAAIDGEQSEEYPDFKSAVAIWRILEAAHQSADSGRVVQID